MSQSVDNSKSVTGDVLAQVAETLKNSTETVRTRLTNTLVERKLASRSVSLLAVLILWIKV